MNQLLAFGWEYSNGPSTRTPRAWSTIALNAKTVKKLQPNFKEVVSGGI